MKNFKTIIAALFAVIIFTACEKEESLEGSDQASSSKITNTSVKSVTTITIDEDSAYEVGSAIASGLGYSSLKVADASYDLVYSGSNFGSTSIPLTSAVSNGSPANQVSKVYINISNRKGKNCSGKKCFCGVGLRCGISGAALVPGINFEADLDVDLVNMTLNVQFVEYVPWASL